MTIDKKTGKNITLSKEAERKNLMRFGTKAFGELSPRNIVQAAEYDIVKKEANAMRKRVNEANTSGILPKETMLPYAFPRNLVQRATSAQDLLKLTVEQRPVPRSVNDEMLFGNGARLLEAMLLACGAEK